MPHSERPTKASVGSQVTSLGSSRPSPPRLTHSTQRVSWHWAAPRRPPHPDVLAGPRSSLPGKTQDAQITRACCYGVPSRCVLRGVWDTFRLRKCLCDTHTRLAFFTSLAECNTVGKDSALRVLSGGKKVEEVSPFSEPSRGTPPRPEPLRWGKPWAAISSRERGPFPKQAAPRGRRPGGPARPLGHCPRVPTHRQRANSSFSSVF